MQVQTGLEPKRRTIAADGSTDALLRHAVQRHLRSGQERVVLALHLSQLLAPGPRPHHRRIARALLDDTAQAHGGQVFPRSDGDLVLICEPSGAPGLVETLTRLFRVDAPTVDRLLALWTLPQDAELVQAYADQAARPHPVSKEPSVAPNTIAAVETLIFSAPLTDLVHRQTAVQLLPSGLQQLYCEFTFSVAALEARTNAPGPAQADPFLFRHLATRMDARMMEALSDDIAHGRLLSAGPALHVNLTLAGILSPAFLGFAEAARRAKLWIGVEISLLEVCADPLGFAAARMALRAQDCAVVLDAVSHPALLVTSIEALEPDLVKLDWTARLTNLASRERRTVAEAIARLGPDRIVLHRADTDAALDWGRSQGLRRFQGRQIDAMLGAARLNTCRHAKRCTLRQCITRATATSAAGRAGCENTALLDSGFEQPAIPA
jgi:hypothetical protein